MRSLALIVSARLLLAAIALAACGKSVAEGPGSAGGNGGAQPGTGGNNSAGAGANAGAAGVDSAAATAGAAGEGKGGATGTAEGGSSTNGGAAALCDGHVGFVKITGELPGGFGTDTALHAGCTDSPLAPYSEPASYTQPPGDTGGKTVRVIACNSDGSLKLDLSLNFSPGTADLQMGSLSYFVNGVLRGMKVSALNETQKPAADWALVPPSSAEGVGKIYEASFTAEGSPAGTPVSVSGAFSVCHVANLPIVK